MSRRSNPISTSSTTQTRPFTSFASPAALDSLVVGESQILGQVRRALEVAQQNGTARLLLNELFQRSLRVGKRARAETDIGRGRLSISTAAVELAGQVFENLTGCCALLVGAGEMGALTAQYLVDSGVERLLVSSRTFARAQSLASRLGGEAVPFEELAAQLAVVDIVISATAAADYVIRPTELRQAMEQRRGRPLFLIDIAVPRDIDPAARDIDNVFLFDVDNLEQVVAANRQEREGEIRCVQAIIDHELKEFLHWFNALGTGPLIRALRQRAAHLQEQELARWAAQLGPLSADERQLVEGILRGYANKLPARPARADPRVRQRRRGLRPPRYGAPPLPARRRGRGERIVTTFCIVSLVAALAFYLAAALLFQGHFPLAQERLGCAWGARA